MAEQLNDKQKLSRSEQITALAHYYRAEAQRSLAWRERLDRTTNWAVGATAAFLGFGFSHPEVPHAFFIFSVAILYILLFVESRRYRFYDAYEYRVRLLHQNFIYNILAHGVLADDPEIEGGTFWRAELASDLRYPQYKMDMKYALGRRLNANYIYLFGILLIGWLLKIKLHPQPALSWEDFVRQAAIGQLPAWITFLLIALCVVHMTVLSIMGRRRYGGRDIVHSTWTKRDRSSEQ